MNETISFLSAAATTGDAGAVAAFTDAVKEVTQDAGQSDTGFCGYHPEMGEARPVAHMEARLSHSGRHWYIDTPLALKGRGITYNGTFIGAAGCRKNGWNQYKVTDAAFKKLESQYRIASEMLL